MTFLRVCLPFVVLFACLGCASLADFVAAVQSGSDAAAPVLPDIPRALAGDPIAISNVVSYLLNAGMAFWVTWERRRRQNGK